MTESTEVPPFRGVFDEMGTLWNVESALNFFYQFLIPQGDMHTNKQKRVRAGLLRWMLTSRNWEERYKEDIDFNKATFDRINKQAIEILLDTSLGELNQNRYYASVEDGVGFAFRLYRIKTQTSRALTNIEIRVIITKRTLSSHCMSLANSVTGG